MRWLDRHIQQRFSNFRDSRSDFDTKTKDRVKRTAGKSWYYCRRHVVTYIISPGLRMHIHVQLLCAIIMYCYCANSVLKEQQLQIFLLHLLSFFLLMQVQGSDVLLGVVALRYWKIVLHINGIKQFAYVVGDSLKVQTLLRAALAPCY